MLIIEDGTGGDALLSLDDFKTYAQSRGMDIADYADDVIEPAIRRASTYISNAFSFKGRKKGGRMQKLAWPRTDVVDEDGWPVDYNTVPEEVADATAEATFYELENPGGLTPAVIMTDRVVREQVGPLSVEYAKTSNVVGSSIPVLTSLTGILSGLLDSYGNSPVVARADRG